MQSALTKILRTPSVIEKHEGFTIIREDLLPGGSKMRFLPYVVDRTAKELVFGGPYCGGAPLCLSEIGKRTGQKVTLFYAARAGELHPRQKLAKENGAKLKFVRPGYMTVVQKRAIDYAEKHGAQFLHLGFDEPDAEGHFVAAMDAVRKKVGNPEQVWCATGSGMLARCLGRAFPASEVIGVAVGLASRHDKQHFPSNVRLLESSYTFFQKCKISAPFQSCPNYDRKAWEMMCAQAKPGALMWNVL